MFKPSPPVSQNVTGCGDGDFKEMIKVKSGHMGSLTCDPVRRGNLNTQSDTRGAHAQRDVHVKMATGGHLQAKDRGLRGNQP